MMKTAIYILFDPRQPDVVRYVGKSTKPEQRLGCHRVPYRSARNPVAHWTRKLGREGVAIGMRVIEWTEDWEMAERRWIAHYREIGAPLLNVEAGGLGSWAKGNKKPKRQGSRIFCDAMIIVGKVITAWARSPSRVRQPVHQRQAL